MRRINSKNYYASIDYCTVDNECGNIDFMLLGADINDIVEAKDERFELNFIMGKPYIRKQFSNYSKDVLYYAAQNCKWGYAGCATRKELEKFLLKTFASDIYNDKYHDEYERKSRVALQVKENNDGTMTISNMSKEMFNAINKILSCTEPGFERLGNDYVLRKFEPCGLTLDEKDALDRECWMI